jgi:hypothetical protein
MVIGSGVNVGAGVSVGGSVEVRVVVIVGCSVTDVEVQEEIKNANRRKTWIQRCIGLFYCELYKSL